MNLKVFLLTVSLACLFTSQAIANEKEPVDYFGLADVEVEEISEEILPYWGNIHWASHIPVGEEDGEIDLDTIINIGKKVWEVIEKNRPVVNVKTDKATALPQGVKGWQGLSGWQDPKSKVYQITYKNLFGMEVVRFAFRIVWVYGGGLEGVGRYIARATIIPAHLDVSWGYTFNAKTVVPTVLNSGTKENPVGAAELELQWSVDTVMKSHRKSVNYFVKGDGSFVNLSNGN
jgi:hypothetical protein